MKKILVFGLSEYYGGIESFFFNYLKFKKNKNLQFDFVPENKILARKNDFENLGCKVYDICNWRKHPLKYKKSIEQILKSQKYDMIYFNCLSAYNIIPLKIAKRNGIKVRIVHSHNSSAPKNILKFVIHFINKKCLLKLSTKRFACSNIAGKWMYGKGSFTVIPNAIDAKKFRFNEKVRIRVRNELGITDDSFVIGFVGRLTYQKNPLFLIDIFKELNSIDKKNILIIVGDGDLNDKVQRNIKRFSLEDKVLFLGSRNDISDLMQAFDLFLLPSRFEGLGIVLLEAQFSGLPCIVSDKVPKEANISNSIQYFSLKKDASKWANKIIKQKKELQSRNTILDSCDEKFDLQVTSNYFFDLIYSLIEKTGDQNDN